MKDLQILLVRLCTYSTLPSFHIINNVHDNVQCYYYLDEHKVEVDEVGEKGEKKNKPTITLTNDNKTVKPQPHATSCRANSYKLLT